MTHEPFQPSDTSPPFNADAATQARIARALEFIAVQIGEINDDLQTRPQRRRRRTRQATRLVAKDAASVLEIIIVINGWWEAERIEIDAGEVIPHTEERAPGPNWDSL